MPVAEGTLYATLPELKAGRRITTADSDAALTRALTAACRQIDRKTGRRFYLDDTATTRIFATTGRLTPDGLLLVDDIGSSAGLVVENGSGSTWTSTTAYEAGPDNALSLGLPVTELAAPVGAWWPGPQVRITARWGWPEVPDEIAMAALLLANRLYLRKDSPEGIAGGGEWGAIRLSRWDPDVEALVSPYILPGFA
ncbi:phage gp6-like head-tail connector protein [Micromonospora zamorensis]|uniref:phage gp6-like head-tail connector protein n=1 Tax=Micromonospora zamorensis TaxID=709883 RepID=UPI0037AF56D5